MGLFIAIYAAIGILFSFYLIITAFNIFICRPREKFWNLFVDGSCYDINATMKATALFNVISDIFILVLPIPSIWRLQVVARKKIGICIVLASGVLSVFRFSFHPLAFSGTKGDDRLTWTTNFPAPTTSVTGLNVSLILFPFDSSACVLSIIRTYYLFQLVGSADRSYRITIHYLWTSGEIAAGVIISCLPILPRLVRTYAPRIHSVFWSNGKMHDMTPVPSSMREKKRPNELNNWHELQTDISDNDPSLDQHGRKEGDGDGEGQGERERGLKDDSSQVSLVPTPPSPDGPDGEQPPGQGQILMTTRIETRTELHTIAVHRALRADLERQQRQQLRW